MTPEQLPGDRTTVVLADDHPIMLSGLKAILSLEPELTIVGEAHDGLEALRLVKELRPGLVVMDIHMPKLDGLGALAAIREQAPDTKVLMLTSMENEEYLFRAIQAGAGGYVLKRAADEELLTAIREVCAGGAFVRPPVAQMLAADYMERLGAGEEADSYELLTPREKEVLALVARGLTNQQMAEELVISARTVETHRAHIMDKLGFKKRSELVKYALRKGYLA